MTVKLELANGEFEMIESGNYVISKVKDFNPMIVGVKIYTNGKLILKKSRKFKWYYKHFTFKTAKVQDELKRIQERQAAAQKAAESENEKFQNAEILN